MGTIAQIQDGLLLLLGIAAVVFEGWTLIDAVRYPARAYEAAGKLSRPVWLAILGVCLVVGIVTMRAVIFSMGWLAVAGAAVYAADVRPALQQVTGRGGPRRRFH